jgi:hypothetical protein
MFATFRAGAAYFAVVFTCGFVLGTVRVLLVAPRVGETAAVLLETPFMLAISWIACGACVERLRPPAGPLFRLGMGATALAMLLAAELGVSVFIFRRTLAEHLAGYRSPGGAIGLAAQVVFAGLPLARTWRSWNALAVVRAVHTAIYVVMVTSIFLVLYAGIAGGGDWLWWPLGLLGIEVVVFVGNGMRCPLTAIAVTHGARDGRFFDTFIPEAFTRHTLAIFAPLIVLGVVLLAVRAWTFAGCSGWLWRC